jgi:phage tail sheath protein FI
MAFQLSPGVNVSEVDLTTVVPSVATTVGGIAGEFAWGPANTIVSISNEVELAERFGKPDANSANAFFVAANFLSYGSDLRVVRSVGASAKNAGVTAGVLVQDEIDYQTNQQTVSNANFFLAKYPGTLGNSIGVSLCDASSYSTWTHKDQFDSAPATSVYATSKGSSSDEMHIVVYDTQGKISGTTGAILEKFGYVSKASDAKNSDGSSNYYKDVLNNKSKYVWFKGHISLATNSASTWGTATANGKIYDSHGTSSILTLTVVNGSPSSSYANGDIVQIQGGTLSTSPNAGSKANASVTINGAGDVISLTITGAGTYLTLPNGTVATSNITGTGTGLTVSVATSNTTFNTTHPLTGGVDDSPNAGQITSAYDKFENPDSVDVSLLMAGATSGSTVPNHLIGIAESRKDCLVFISPDREDVVDNYGDESTDVAAAAAALTKSSYAVMDSGYKYQYDKYNDTYRWVPLNGDIAGLCVRTDSQRDPWFSPAGLNRGVIKNVVKLAWNPTKTERDTIYKAGVNPVVTFPGEGTILYGDKTLLNRPQAFDRINVRRLFIVLEKAIARAARSSLFEFNDEFTRAAFVNIVEPYLRDVQGRRGIYDFRVVCDTTNNTAEVIDQNQFVGDIYIKPARSINFIQLNFTAVRTGVDFEEIVGRV